MRVLRNGNLLSVGAVVLLSLIWGYNWVVMKVAIADCSPLVFAALRVWLSVLALIAMLFFMKRPFAMPPPHYVIPLGLLQTTGFVGFSLWGLEYGGAGQTAILVYMMPIWLMLMAWQMLNERLHGLQWSALAFALLGLLAILKPWDFSGNWCGILLALLSGMFWAMSAIWQKLRAPPEQDIFTVTLWQTAIGGLGLTIMAMIVDPLAIHWTQAFICALLYSAILGTALAYFLWAYSLQNLPSGIAGMATLLVPIIGVTAAWLQLGERPGSWEIAGILAILVALVFVSWQHLLPAEKL